MRRHPGRRELTIFAAGYVTYFGVRAVTEGRVDRALYNAASLLQLERTLGIAWEGAIQGLVGGSRFLEGLVNAIYVYGHWPVLIVAGVLLYRFRRGHYYTLRNACLLTGLLGLLVFALYPVAPPRLTSLPLMDTYTGGSAAYRQILPPSLVNQYAAMPSFHAGWNLAVGIVVYQATRHWALRVFALLMPVAMAFSVVATANHFVIDVAVGVALVLAALALRRATVVLRSDPGSGLLRRSGRVLCAPLRERRPGVPPRGGSCPVGLADETGGPHQRVLRQRLEHQARAIGERSRDHLVDQRDVALGQDRSRQIRVRRRGHV